MSKPTKTEAELIAMARAELKVHADCPDGISIAVLGSEDSWEFRTEAESQARLSRMRRDDHADRRSSQQAVRCEEVRGIACFRHCEEQSDEAIQSDAIVLLEKIAQAANSLSGSRWPGF